MSGEARSAYHAVPVVFKDEGYCESLKSFINNDSKLLVDYLENFRININVRSMF